MGVADNKTYKNQSPYFDVFKINGDEYPSINDEKKINSTIKKNPYASNVEIEGKEMVLQPDLSALFKAVGKRHSKGGMDVYLKPNSFVFSDDKTLGINENEHKMFELKEGGFTPAAVVKKNVDPKHYNTLIANITDPFKDDLAKKSSSMMLEKYIQTLGNIAFIQEKKKGFPQGTPAFSDGTAPVYNDDIKTDIMQNKQYAKYGGPIFATGGWSPDKCPCGGVYPNCNPCSPAQLQELLKKANRGTLDQAKGMDKIGSVDNTDLYHTGTDPMTNSINVPTGIPGGRMNEGWKRKIQSLINQGATIDQLVKQRHGTKEGLQQMFKFPAAIDGTDKLLAVANDSTPPPKITENPYAPNTTIGAGQVTGGAQNEFPIDWQFTPWQKASQAYQWGQYANVKRYMPYRSRYNATYISPALVNPEQAVGDAKGMANQQLSSLNTLNPILRNAQASSSYGQLLDQIPAIRSQYDNQNAGILNQTRQYNNQIKNQESMVNMGNDQQYYKESIIGRQNFDNMRDFKANQAMDTVMRDVESNQKLAYNQATLNNPAWRFDYKTGNFVRNPKSVLDVYGTSQGDYIQNLLQDVDFKSLTPELKIQFIRELQRGKALQYLPQAFGSTPSFKRGGMYNPYK